MQKTYSPFFSKNMSVYAIFNDQSFNKILIMTTLLLNNWAQVIHSLATISLSNIKTLAQILSCERGKL